MARWIRNILEGSDEIIDFPRHPVAGRITPWRLPQDRKIMRRWLWNRDHREWFVTFKPLRYRWFAALIWERLGYEQAPHFDCGRGRGSCWVTLWKRRLYLRGWCQDLEANRAENERRMEERA